MNDTHDSGLRAAFALQRRCDHADAPAWREEWLRLPLQPQPYGARWMFAPVAAACLVVLAIFLMAPPAPEPQLSEALPVWFDSPPAELFGSLRPSEPHFIAFEAPSDFLLPTHLNFNLP